MVKRFSALLGFIFLLCGTSLMAQGQEVPELLSIDRIYNSAEFREEYARPIRWIENGEAFVTVEKSAELAGADELVRYQSATQARSIFVPGTALKTATGTLGIQDFSLSPDGSKVLIFTNSSRVWRSNTKGDYWVYDLQSATLKQLGTKFEPSSLMFAKFSADNRFVFYVHKFNLYKEDFQSGTLTQLTHDGTGEVINGTFDWVYEEEFGKRDGFAVSPGSDYLAYWQLDASGTGTFYMINNTDSIYSSPIPLQYPKVGEPPSAARIGVIDLKTQQTHWIPLPGAPREKYIPGLQWVNADLLLLQQMNRHQNELSVWTYQPSSKKLQLVYVEKETTWVDLGYPDLTANSWGNNDLPLVEDNSAFLRMTESDAWRHIYKVALATGKKTLVTPFEFDVASMRSATEKNVYFMASPDNSMQRYLFQTDLKGKGKRKRITPEIFSGVNNYDISPNGAYAVHTHQSARTVRTVRFIELPSHKTLKVLVDNEAYKQKLTRLKLPQVRFSQVKTEAGLDIDVRMVLPIDFDSTRKYPVVFHVYGEPWGQVATDQPIGLWNILLAQKGYVVIDMDNRGTPCLKGSQWRKSIYRKIGVINVRDQAQAAREILKLDYLDNSRTAVWGWSGGGSMTLNLMFQYPEIYGTGIAVAAVSNQLIYDNIYQERYMGLPQENMEDFVKGSPITHAKNLKGNLLIVHGTGDDNVHYQSAELLINELIRQNKQFRFMPYPNRSHGIYEGINTKRHLYTMMLNYLLENNPVN